ncbi:uncharacterized protein DDB_G0284459-like [Hyalella azteca]|uniref:Uncharacterized protein DDB_G0284459-like n=1 Tax=Hyalella azteca TaxID=294128 RepID=A0A979FRH9_HYAAZ|nr:uncharacterized protein DDB_G0284459-like [Hyalella azteca]
MDVGDLNPGVTAGPSTPDHLTDANKSESSNLCEALLSEGTSIKSCAENSTDGTELPISSANSNSEIDEKETAANNDACKSGSCVEESSVTEDALLLLALSSAHNDDQLSPNEASLLLAEMQSSKYSDDKSGIKSEVLVENTQLKENNELKKPSGVDHSKILEILSGTDFNSITTALDKNVDELVSQKQNILPSDESIPRIRTTALVENTTEVPDGTNKEEPHDRETTTSPLVQDEILPKLTASSCPLEAERNIAITDELPFKGIAPQGSNADSPHTGIEFSSLPLDKVESGVDLSPNKKTLSLCEASKTSSCTPVIEENPETHLPEEAETPTYEEKNISLVIPPPDMKTTFVPYPEAQITSVSSNFNEIPLPSKSHKDVQEGSQILQSSCDDEILLPATETHSCVPYGDQIPAQPNSTLAPQPLPGTIDDASQYKEALTPPPAEAHTPPPPVEAHTPPPPTPH